MAAGDLEHCRQEEMRNPGLITLCTEKKKKRTWLFFHVGLYIPTH